MDPPDGATPAHLNGQNTLLLTTVLPQKGIVEKHAYATKIATTSGSTSPVHRPNRESVKAIHSTTMECIRFYSRHQITMESWRQSSVKIGVYDNYNVFLDFTNKDDFNTIWYRRVIEIEGQQMWLQRWSPDFKPEEDLPIAPVLVLLHGLPFHMHTWHYVKQVVSEIGTPLEMDLATRGETRPSMAKVIVEIDLLKPQPEYVYLAAYMKTLHRQDLSKNWSTREYQNTEDESKKGKEKENIDMTERTEPRNDQKTKEAKNANEKSCHDPKSTKDRDGA
ncbi:hypothetical protein A4A49_51173 [Nicotiana attenuata]|uniref:DUF4283 domain-containing protein n=1 Tax=Nicotiana attenuata TaxID=49451 RepID=A0A1J6HSH6_NICAT|nr:hypothetical protein A4A49_51173 [Nicotiana attenuata]